MRVRQRGSSYLAYYPCCVADMNSGGVYERLKKKRKASRDRRNAVAIGAPKNKGGHPKKRPFNFNKNKSSPTTADGAPNTHTALSRPTTRTTRSTSSSNNATSTSTSTARRSSTTQPIQSTRHTRNNGRLLRVDRPEPTRYKPELFANNQPPRENTTIQDKNETIIQQKCTIKCLRKQCRELCRRLDHAQLLGIDHTTTGDRPVINPAVLPDDDLSAADINHIIKRLLHNGGSNNDYCRQVFDALGLISSGKVKADTRKENLAKGIRLLIDLHFNNVPMKDRAHIMGGVLFNGRIFNEEYTHLIATTITKTVTSTVFSPVAMVKAMDVSSAGNDTSNNEIAMIEKNKELTEWRRGQSMMPLKWKFCHPRAICNDLVVELLDIKEALNTQFGEVVNLDVERTIRLALKAFGLEEKATTGDGIVNIALTGDGAEFEGKTNHTLVGVKITDKDAKDIKTGSPLFTETLQPSDGDDSGDDLDSIATNEARVYYKNAQTTDVCIPLTMGLCRETNEYVKEIVSPVFKKVIDIEKNGLPARGGEPEIPAGKIKVICCGDMCFLRKMLNTGGTFKCMHFACPWCEVCTAGDGEDVFSGVSGTRRCIMCEKNDPEGSEICHHRAVLDETRIAECAQLVIDEYVSDYNRTHSTNLSVKGVLEETLPDEEVECFDGYRVPVVDGVPAGREKIRFTVPKKLKDVIPDDDADNVYPVEYLNDICNQLIHTEEKDNVIEESKIHYRPNEEAKEDRPSNIEYKTGKDGNETNDQTFISNVSNDLFCRGYDMDYIMDISLEERVQLLRERLEIQVIIRRCKNAVDIDENSTKHRLIGPGEALPCTLHSHVRSNEKIFAMLLAYGLRGCKTSTEREQFIKEVAVVVNRDVLGRSLRHEMDESGWSFPIDKKNNEKLAEFSHTNNMARKITKNMQFVAQICLENYEEDVLQDWLKVIELFGEVTEMLDDKKEYKEEEVYAFQKKADEFCKVYIKLTGMQGMTNYLHMLYAGHFSYFLLKYGNLYRFSQQGWENVNGKVKRRHFSSTQKGGGRVKGGTGKLKPIVMAMGREMLWKFGYLDELFKYIGHDDNELNIEYNKVKPTPKHKKNGEELHREEIEEFAYSILKMMAEDVEQGLV